MKLTFAPLVVLLFGCSPDAAKPAKSAEPATLTCNGHIELCERPLNEVVFPGTHNSMASTHAGFAAGVSANQNPTVIEQVEDGIRLLNLDVYEGDSALVLCHGFCELGETNHLEVLGEIGSFLEENPGEILMITYEDHAPLEDIAAEFEQAGLASKAYVHDGGDWPTLQEMRDADTRIFIAVQSNSDAPEIIHNLWTWVWDTPYAFDDIASFNCDHNRGQTTNPLFQVNHWVGTPVGLPNEGAADEVNGFDVLFDRLDTCRNQTGQLPNFVMVDYYDHGDLFQAVDALNGF